jgi:hypothetical protein
MACEKTLLEISSRSYPRAAIVILFLCQPSHKILCISQLKEIVANGRLTRNILIGELMMLTRVTSCCVLLASLLLTTYAQQPVPKTHLKVGGAAPEFTLRGTDGKTYKLSDFRGKKNVVLAFYVLAFTGG